MHRSGDRFGDHQSAVEATSLFSFEYSGCSAVGSASALGDKRFVNPRSKLIHTFSHCKQDHRHTGGILRAPLISAGACGDLRRGRSGTHRRLLFIPSFSKSAINKSKKTVVINQFYCVEIYIKYNFLFRYILCKIYKHILQDISNLPRG